MSATRKFLATSALVGLMATGAYAQSDQLVPYNFEATKDVSASHVIGMSVYATKGVIDTTKPVSATDTSSYEDIGKIKDLLMSQDGKVNALVIGIGGFLGMDEHRVAVETSSVHFVPKSENPDEFLLIVNADKAQLKALPEYTDARPKDPAMTTTEALGADRPLLKSSTMEHDGYTTVTMGDISTDDLDDAKVYGPNDEDIGEIEGLVVSADGRAVEKILLDIGGFLGMGEHEVALMPSELQIMRKDSGGDVRVYVNATEDEFKALPEYKK